MWVSKDSLATTCVVGHFMNIRESHIPGFINPRSVKSLCTTQQLTRKDVDFQWGPEHEEAFEYIKDKIASIAILAYFDPTESVTIQCDTSMEGLEAVLYQTTSQLQSPASDQHRTELQQYRKRDACNCLCLNKIPPRHLWTPRDCGIRSQALRVHYQETSVDRKSQD